MPSKLKGSDNSKLQASAYVVKQIGNVTEIDIKDRVDKIVKEEGVTENMLNRLNSTLALVGKEIGQKHAANLCLQKGRKNIEMDLSELVYFGINFRNL